MKRRREIIVPASASPADRRPIRAETRATLVASIARGRRWLDEIVAGTVTECRADCCTRQMQHSTSQYDDLARVPRARSREGCRRRTTASRHRRHPPARCSCRVVAPIRDARFVDLILAVFIEQLEAGARNGFGEPRDREPKSTLSRPQPAAETARPVFEPRKCPQIAGYSSETGKRRFASDCVVGPGGLEPPNRSL